MAGNSEFLYDAYNSYYENGIQAMQRGEDTLAKSLLIKAAESLNKLAEQSSGELKQARKERVNRILEVAESLDDSKKNNSNMQSRSKNIDKKSDSSANKDTNKNANVKTDDSETVFKSAEVPSITFDDVAGLEDVKQAVRRIIINPRYHPELYKKFDIPIGGGVLMYGLPGTGKTLIAKAIAAEAKANFYNIKCSDIVSKWFGEAEKNIKNLFETARQDEQAVIFFDEFEAIGAKRSGGDSVLNRLVPELLAQIDGFSKNSSTLLLIAATNRPWDIDTAFLRPGRFPQKIYISLPDSKAREFLINRTFSKVPLSKDLDIAQLVNYTDGYSGADLVELCSFCKMQALERELNSGNPEEVIQADLDLSCKKVKSSIFKEDVIKLEKFERGEIV